ncbi:16S rRNA (cytosine(1402)-N(4))-methyltransferase RsmH [Helicobacter sp. 11S02596-1]|uniref:16S rRNA (cytosine(1402)-N(4))-methyltransferase RsmH n=1 Tax=Helicobacter sp. 11S02596-1 TaxID=1476194 RepID=UPI000BA64054|nr:16S rRNA (cytosine(1402)-N(4))-methyltransferase RsmH [Helicobacter sp. 11S02596-1]PAF42866.1 16S rRNA (cytosine(1402)-N(4))-methyltransferase [Helicobacter sp. 11S02596-1]
MTNPPHIPVLLDDVLEVFARIDSGIIIDCTLGFGGHSHALLENNPNICIIGIDKDAQAREFAQNRLQKFGDRFVCVSGGFGEKIGEILDTYGERVKGVLADIGVSSLQLDSPERGFGFGSDTLDMRMDKQSSLNAQVVINHYSAYELQRIFRDYGEIREYKKMATLIATQRDKKPFESAKELSEFLQRHFKNPRIHPATLAFQAIRIEVNDELGELERLLKMAGNLRGAVFAVISFHSLEDRMVKNAFKEWGKSCICDTSLYKCECGSNHARGVSLTKKPKIASPDEINQNPRARSAKLRAFAFKD